MYQIHNCADYNKTMGTDTKTPVSVPIFMPYARNLALGEVPIITTTYIISVNIKHNMLILSIVKQNEMWYSRGTQKKSNTQEERRTPCTK